MDDPALLRAYIDDASEDAFAALVNRYTGLVYATALRQVGGNTHLARDITQSVFTDLARKAGELRGRPVLTGWLYTSTQLVVAATFRAEKRRKQREQEAHTMMQISAGDTPDSWSRLRPVLDEVMRELGDEARESILLRFFEGRPFAEIGEKLALSENAARMRVERALDKMHALLSKRGLTSSGAALAVVLAQQALSAAPAGLAAEIARAALTNATQVATPAWSMLSATKTTIAVVALVGAICVGIFVMFVASYQGVRGEIVELRRANQAAAASLDVDRQRLAQRSVELAERRQVAAAVLRLPAARADSGTPADRRMMLRIRSALTLRYAGLFRRLKLGPSQQESFEKLLLRKSFAEVGALNALSYRPPDGAAATLDLNVVNAVKAAVTSEIDEEIRSLLGIDLFQRYADFARTVPVRQQVEAVAAASEDTGGGLSDDEIDGLTRFVARAADYTRPLPEAFLAEGRASLAANQQSALARLQAMRLARYTILEANLVAAAKGLVQLPLPSGLELDTL